MAKEKTLRDGNGRVARLARWLSEAPASASVDVLVLEHKAEGEWLRLQMWPRASVNAGLAAIIDTAITELANELGAYVTARVVWMDSEKQAYWTEHALRVQPEDMDGQQAFDGTASSMAIQNQRHQERVFATNISLIGTSMAALREVNGDLREANRITAAENHRLREELRAAQQKVELLTGEVSRLQTIADEALSQAESAAEKKQDESQSAQIVQLITAAAQQHMAPKARA
jgi:hypothetical protein